MGKKRKRKAQIKVREVNLYKTPAERGLTGEKLAGFLEGLDVAAYMVKINGIVNCAEEPCGYRRATDPRCKECPQNDAEFVIGELYRLKGEPAASDSARITSRTVATKMGTCTALMQRS